VDVSSLRRHRVVSFVVSGLNLRYVLSESWLVTLQRDPSIVSANLIKGKGKVVPVLKLSTTP
jgi:hypothetical protein